MRRRELITLIGGMATLPFAVRAKHVPVIGFLCSGSSVSDAPRLAAVARGLSESGFVLGRDVSVKMIDFGLWQPIWLEVR